MGINTEKIQEEEVQKNTNCNFEENFQEREEAQKKQNGQNSFLASCGEVADDVVEGVFDIAGVVLDGVSSTASGIGECAGGVLECLGDILGGIAD
jgi:hypothetical protein